MKHFVTFWMLWFGAYGILVTGAMGLPRVERFAETVDHVDQLWVAIVFLNLPLQLILAMVAMMLWKAREARSRKVGTFVAVVNTGLILTHIVISFVVVP